MGQWIFYGCGAVCLLLGMGLIGIGKHFKLGSLAFCASAACVAIAVSISKYSWIWLYAIGAGIVLLCAFVGFNLWNDYKSRPNTLDPRVWKTQKGDPINAG